MAKKIHKRLDTAATVCKIQNKTWAFTYTDDWKDVNCQNCLAKKKKGPR